MAFYQYKHSQFLPTTKEKLWEFISCPANLKDITPPHMRFEILSAQVPEMMYPGMIIEYIVCPVPSVPTKWVTEITHVHYQKYFVDEQRVGPYKMWHHEHIMEPVEGGVYMHDIVSYQPPVGVLGRIANSLFIAKKIRAIFAFRHKVLEEKFGKASERISQEELQRAS